MSDELDLDREITEILAGGAGPGADRALLWLASSVRPTPPPGLTARIDAAVARRAERPDRRVAFVALALATAFVTQGVGSVVAGHWIAGGIGESFSPHATFELGLALVAVGVCVAAAAVSRAWAPVSVLTGTPLSTALALHGVQEFGKFAPGAALHTTEGLLGLALLAVWLADLRDRKGHRREEDA